MQKVKVIFDAGEFLRAGKGRSETALSLIRNQQARGSTPRAGSREIRGLANEANLFYY
jgi:hypothetical protein